MTKVIPFPPVSRTEGIEQFMKPYAICGNPGMAKLVMINGKEQKMFLCYDHKD